jgi:hypothetical protein
LAVDLFPVSFTAFRGVSGKFLGSSMTGEVWRAPQPVISGVYFLFKDRALMKDWAAYCRPAGAEPPGGVETIKP